MNSMLNWQQAFDAGVTISGGKGWNLARLARYGFDIPKGGVLSAAVYRQLVEQPSITSQINALGAVPNDCLNATQTQKILKQLQQSIKAQALPATVQDDIHHYLQQQGLENSPLAIRSSATLEDSEQASFAGIHDSFLNVHGNSAIEQAILACYASLWSLRAISYRRKMNIDDHNIAAALVINQLLKAHTSGVAFSCDPVSGRTDICLINANFGLGESVVAGITEPDQFHLHAHHPHILSRDLGNKNIQTVANKTGGTRQQKTAALTPQATLNDEQLLQLKRLVLRVFHAMGHGEQHQDIEWVHDGNRFWLVQARPVTALPVYSIPGLKGQPPVWSNGNFRDAIPMVLPPLPASFCQFHIDHILTAPIERIGYPLPAGISFARRFQGRFYCNVSLMQWVWYDAAGLSPKVTNRNMGGHQTDIAIDHAQHGSAWKKVQRLFRILKFLRLMNDHKKRAPEIYNQVECYVDNLMATDFSVLDDEQLLTLYRQVDNKVTEYDAPFIILTCTSGAGSMLVRILEKKLDEEAISIANSLLAGVGSITSADHGYRIYELAQLLASDETAHRWLNNASDINSDDWQQLPGDSLFKQAFQQFLDEYGHRAVYEMDYSRPRWREDPSYLFGAIKNAPTQSPLAEIRVRQKQHTQKAWQRVDQAFPWLMRKQIRSLVKKAAEGAACKEAAKSAYVRFLVPLRALMLEVGKRLCKRGLLAQAQDVFYCVWPELEAILKKEWKGLELKLLIAERKIRVQRLTDLPTPDVIIDNVPSYVQTPAKKDNSTLHGIAVAAGVAQGNACIAQTPEQGVAMPSGAVLIAPSTDPAWTPLFLNASALVMETGGYLSHGSIVAREYGIPAVVNVPGLFNVINNGDSLKVNGDAGTITRITT